MLAMGYWSDVFQILIAFLGEAVCLLPSWDLLQALLKVWSLPRYVLVAVDRRLNSHVSFSGRKRGIKLEQT